MVYIQLAQNTENLEGTSVLSVSCSYCSTTVLHITCKSTEDFSSTSECARLLLLLVQYRWMLFCWSRSVVLNDCVSKEMTKTIQWSGMV